MMLVRDVTMLEQIENADATRRAKNRENQRRYRARHGAKLAAKLKEKRDKDEAFRVRAVIRARAHRLAYPEKHRRSIEKNRWVRERIIAMARDDGIYDALAKQWEKEHGERSL